MPANYYEILGLDRDATYEAIRRAYRRLALQFHPDRNDAPDAEERFREIIEAYQVLSVASTRIDYDLFIERQEQEAERRQREETERQRESEERRQREERARRAAEEYRRKQAEAERLRREEAEQRQRRAEERRQREERVRRAAEERHRRQAEERLRETADQPEAAEPHEGSRSEENAEAVTTALVVTQLSPASAPPVAARNAWFVGGAIAASVAAFLVLAAGIFGVVYLLMPTTTSPELIIQPTPDLSATITAAVAAAWPTSPVNPLPPTMISPETPVQPTAVSQTVPSPIPPTAIPMATSIPPDTINSTPTVIPVVATFPTLAPTFAPSPTPTLHPTPQPVATENRPDPPRNFEKISGTGQIVYLKWDAPQYNGGGTTLQYEINISGSDLKFKNTTTYRGFPSPDLETVPEFTPGTTYLVSVAACNGTLCSEPVALKVNADPILPTPTPSNLVGRPGEVRNIRIFDSTNDSISLVWDQPSNNGGSPIEEYLVMLDTNGDTRSEWVYTPNIHFADLLHSKRYVVKIMAANSRQDGPFSTFSFTTHSKGPITTP